MLPSLGYFQDFPCPYYDSNTPSTKRGSAPAEEAPVTCNRPFCHFKHVRKEDIEPVPEPPPKVPEYKPAPKLLALPEIIMFPPKRKTNLEYQPEKPGLDASPSKRLLGKSTTVPLYVPAPKSDANGDIDAIDIDFAEDDNDLRYLENDIAQQAKEDAQSNSSECSKETVKEEIKTTATSTLSSSSKHKSSSSKSSSRHDRSRSRERKSSRDKDREKRVKEKDRDKEKSSRESSHISSSKHKHSSSTSSSTKSSRSDKHRESSSSETKHRSSSSRSSTSSSSTKKKEHSSSSSKHKSSKSKSSSSTLSADETKSSTSAQAASPAKTTENNRNASLNGTYLRKTEIPVEIPEATEEDIMRECEMIYDQLEMEFAAMHKPNSSNAQPEAAINENSMKRKLSLDVDTCAEAAAAAIQKKRVAHENASKVKPHTPQLPCKQNHIRNAMQAIFNRRAELRQKQEEDSKKAAAELLAAEEKVREANEALRLAKEKALTPLIPKSALTPPTRIRSIAPVANMIAFERAKRKVEELKAEKKPAFTAAQIRKGQQRVAHKPTGALDKVEEVKQPKPPVLEANNTKISFNIRMQYYELMVKQCLSIYPNVADAWERAQTEELAVFKKVYTPVIYKNSCMLTINKLRKEAIEAGNKPQSTNKIESHEVVLAGKRAQMCSWSVEKKTKLEHNTNKEPFDNLASDKAYDIVYELRLTEEQLVANGFPRPGKRSGTAIINNTRPNRRPNETERYCSRCGKVFNLLIYEQVCTDECNYHPKSTGYRRGFADNIHRCCQQPAGTPGCTYANYHVSDYYDPDKLTGFVTPLDKPDDYVGTRKDIFALDCEMCYTTHGIELTRITVVDVKGSIVYDALVKPENKIVDYNTVYSGITEKMLADQKCTLRNVQAVLLSLFHSRTILVGHSLESDMKALKLIHKTIVDTSVLFPHKMGLPKKRALKTLCIENLKRIIQENESGHDSAEDAEVCIQLIKFYLKNKIS